MNQVFLSGNLASDVKMRTTSSGVNTASFRLAVQRRFSNKQGERETDFFDIVVWRQTADFCGKYLSKGRKVIVKGSLRARSYDDSDGTKRYVTEVVADEVEFADSKKDAGNGNVAATNSYIRQRSGGFTPVPDNEPLPF